MASIVVQKYGGSSVADVSRLRKVAQRVVDTAKAGHQVCVVVSAMGGTTDDLMSLANEVCPAPHRRELDMLLTCGERISMALLSMAIIDLGHRAISFTGSQSGIMTNDRHSGARIIEVKPVRVQDELARGLIVIVGGFQGVSYKREITTLGRGGSDTTAVALAAALNAEYCELCSDVDGVYSGDPNVIDAAQLIDAISYDAMKALAEAGAKVMHPQAVEFARKAGITVYARATSTPSNTKAGTRISSGATASPAVAGVAGMKNLIRLSTSAGTKLLDVLDECAIEIVRCNWLGETLQVFISCEDVPDWHTVKQQLAESLGTGLDCQEQLGSASVVGADLGLSPASIARVKKVADDCDVPIIEIDATPLRVTVFAAQDRIDELCKGLHAAFVEAE